MNKNIIYNLIINLATIGPLGKKLPAPGTFGSLFGLILGYLVLNVNLLFFIFVTIIVIILGIISIKLYLKKQLKDPPEVIIDEVIGQLIALFPLNFFLSFSYIELFVGFILFRIFDISKIWPICFFDNKKNTFGIISDDICAGIMSAIILFSILFYI